MAYSKTLKAGVYSPVTQMVTMKELLAMTEYLHNFRQKYSSKRTVIKKKK